MVNDNGKLLMFLREGNRVVEEIEPIDMSQVFDDLLNDDDIVKELKDLNLDDEELSGIEIISNRDE